MTVDVLSHLWLPGEVKLNYTSRQYFVTMGLYLMTVLLPFETCTTLTFRDLRDITQLENRDLGRHVQQLVDINLVNTTATNVVQLSAAASSAEVNTVSYSVGMTYTSYDLVVLYNIHTYIHPLNGPLSGTTQVSRYQKGKTNLDFTGARDSEWQWHQLGHMQVCT